MVKTILVTGGAGFIGNHLAEQLLNNKHRVVVFDDLSLGRMNNIQRFAKNKNFVFIKGNILNKKAFNKLFQKFNFDVIFHFAANSDIANSFKSPDTDFKRTFMTTREALEQMRLNGIKEIVFPSTGAVYGDTNNAVAEDSGSFNPISHYGAAKLASEAYISSYCHNYAIKAWIIRFPNVVGEYATHGAVFDFINKLKKNPRELEVLGNGKQIKPYIYVKDIVEAVLFIWKNARESLNIYNVGVSSRTTVKEIAEMVAEEMGLTAKIKYTGGDRGWVGDVAMFRYNFAKISKLGWRPKLSSNQAVRKSIKKILASNNFVK